jgi:phosphatidyl-myo-inositol dimannoside synthase
VKVLILATDIYTRGGIARYTAALASALGESPGVDRVDVLPLLDDAERRFNPAEFRILRATTPRLGPRQKVQHVVRALKCSSSGYDLVICSHLALAPVAALIRLQYGTPYLVVCHGSEAWEKLPAWKQVALRHANAVLAVSRFTADAVAKANGIPNAKIRLLPNAIPEDMVRRLLGPNCGAGWGNEASDSAQGPLTHRFAVPPLPRREGTGVRGHSVTAGLKPRPSPPRHPAGVQRDLVLLSVGSLKTDHAYKGADTVIEALPSIIYAVPGVRYFVVGDGDNRPNLERLAAARGVSERVTFAGEVTDAELAEHYRACDVFVLPSRASRRQDRRNVRTEGEGFGRVYVEAALAGKPVVGSRDGGAAEAVVDGRTGLLVDPRSAGEVAEAVIALLRAPERAAAMGAEGRRWALENFTIEAMRRSLENILSSAVRCQFSVVNHVCRVASHEQRSTNYEPRTTNY